MDIKEKLKKLAVTEWSMMSSDIEEYQLYHSKDKIESLRRNKYSNYRISLINVHDGKLGEADVTVSTLENIDPLLEDAKEMTKMQSNKVYSLPKSFEEDKSIKTFEVNGSELSSNLRELYEKISLITSKFKDVSLASLEIFSLLASKTLENSNGVKAKKRNQYNTLEIVFSNKEYERWSLFNNVKLSNMNGDSIEEFIEKNIKYLKDMGKSTLADINGEYPVCIDSTQLIEILEPLFFHSSGYANYEKLSKYEKGLSLDMKGDKLNIYNNPNLDYLYNSYNFSSEGAKPQKTQIIKDGNWEDIIASKKYSDYLSVSFTGDMGNIDIELGETESSNLLDNSIYVVSFSAIDVDNISGDFFGEVRLGYHIKDGKWIPIKGNGVKGNIFEAMKLMHISNTLKQFNYYKGPDIIRFEKLKISSK